RAAGRSGNAGQPGPAAWFGDPGQRRRDARLPRFGATPGPRRAPLLLHRARGRRGIPGAARRRDTGLPRVQPVLTHSGTGRNYRGLPAIISGVVERRDGTSLARLGLTEAWAAPVLASLGWWDGDRPVREAEAVMWALARSPDPGLALRTVGRLAEA